MSDLISPEAWGRFHWLAEDHCDDLRRELTRLRSWLGHIGASTQDADVLGDTVRALRGDDAPGDGGDDTGETTRPA